MLDIDKVRKIKKSFQASVTDKFRTAACDGPVNGVGISKKASGEFCIAVLLSRVPTEQEKESLPDNFNGVDVEYKVTGPIVAL